MSAYLSLEYACRYHKEVRIFGSVANNGQPVQGAAVSFRSVTYNTGWAYVCSTAADGTFSGGVSVYSPTETFEVRAEVTSGVFTQTEQRTCPGTGPPPTIAQDTGGGWGVGGWGPDYLMINVVVNSDWSACELTCTSTSNQAQFNNVSKMLVGPSPEQTNAAASFVGFVSPGSGNFSVTFHCTDWWGQGGTPLTLNFSH